MRSPKIKVFFYPSSILSWLNPFWRILKEVLSKYDVEVKTEKLSFYNLLRNKIKVEIIHFHYVYPDISRDDYPYLPNKIWNKFFLFNSWYQTKTFGIRLKVAKFLGYKIICTVHNLDFHNAANNNTKKNLSSLYKIIDSIVTMGKNDQQKLKVLLNKENITLIPHFHYEGIYQNQISKKAAKKKLGIHYDQFVYLFFGTVRRHRGADILVKKFKEMKLNATLLIAGDTFFDPSYVKEIKQLAGGNKNIIITPEPILNSEIQIYMNSADIVVFPFRHISNSGALILAKSFYKPTICMDKGNLKDYTNPSTDILVKNETELEKELVKAKHRRFPTNKNEYLKGIPSPDEIAKMYKIVYKTCLLK